MGITNDDIEKQSPSNSTFQYYSLDFLPFLEYT